jgi:general stress protein YciG
MSVVETPKPKSRRGFAAMAPEKRRRIAAKGGAAVHASLRSFAKDRALAARAGALGGAASKGGGRRKPEPV